MISLVEKLDLNSVFNKAFLEKLVINRDEALKEMIRLLEEKGAIADPGLFLRSLKKYQYQKKSSTNIYFFVCLFLFLFSFLQIF